MREEYHVESERLFEVAHSTLCKVCYTILCFSTSFISSFVKYIYYLFILLYFVL